MRIRFVDIVGLFILMTSGCFFHAGYPSGYYGPGPSVIPQQPSNGYPTGPMYPSPTYQPGGSYPAPINGGSPYVPGNSPGLGGPTPIFSPTDSGTPSTYETPGRNDNSPRFDPTPSGGKTVPLPNDDTDFGRGSGSTQRPLTPTTSANDSDDITPFSQKESRLPRPQPENGDPYAETESEYHQPMVRQASGSDDGDVHFAGGANTSQKIAVRTFDHHPEFEWVQGTVSYDKPTKTWSIIYDDNPDATDPLGGDLTLAYDPATARFRDGDKVRIIGALDQSDVDSLGKPKFRMTQFKRL